MKKNLFLLCALLLAGCVAMPQIREFPTQATWPDTTKDKVSSACLTALQFQNFNLEPLGTSKESGLIIAERDPFRLDKYNPRFMGFYRLQIMVSEISGRKILIDINVKASRRGPTGGLGWSAEREQIIINNQLAADMEELFNNIERLAGKAEYYKRTTLRWN